MALKRMEGPHVLVVHTSSSNAKLITGIVERQYPEKPVAEYTDHADAENHLNEKAHRGMVELVITNAGTVRTPSGIEFIKRIRQRGKEIPIVVTSGNPNQAELAMQSGANEFVSDEGSFVKNLQAALKKHLG
ncbi:response regulator [Candidatus Micrarchaeota archaeon]|nr:response regulator [Candidatus Micrarchaeota archaeon]